MEFGAQLVLELVPMKELRIPWEGRSPRDLTRVGLSGIFKAQAAKNTGGDDRTGQLELWPELAEEGPAVVYRGAPLLRALPRRQ